MEGAQITLGQNAIANGNAESGAGSTDGNVVAVPGWTATGQFTAVQYGIGGGFVATTDPGPANRGNNYFAGGPASLLSTGTQTLDVSNIASQINAGGAAYTLSGFLGGFATQDDNAVLTAIFLGNGTQIGSSAIGPVTELDRNGLTGLQFRTTSGFIPVGTNEIEFSLVLRRLQGSYDDGYADNLSFIATAGSPSATPEPAAITLLALGLGVICATARRFRA